MKIVGPLLAFAVVVGLVVVLAKGFDSDPHEVPFLLTGKKAPDFTIKRLDNDELVSSTAYKGKPMVINFWATWCGPCAQEHPNLEWAASKYKDRVSFMGIVFEDTEASTKQFLASRGWNFTQLFDPKSTVAVDYAVSGVPETYFINAQGIIVSKYAGPISKPLLDQRISEILQ